MIFLWPGRPAGDTRAFEVRQALASTTHEFRAAVEGGRFANQISVQQAPSIHGAAKLGRNDPCCASGKKSQRCRGKDT